MKVCMMGSARMLRELDDLDQVEREQRAHPVVRGPLGEPPPQNTNQNPRGCSFNREMKLFSHVGVLPKRVTKA